MMLLLRSATTADVGHTYDLVPRPFIVYSTVIAADAAAAVPSAAAAAGCQMIFGRQSVWKTGARPGEYAHSSDRSWCPLFSRLGAGGDDLSTAISVNNTAPQRL